MAPLVDHDLDEDHEVEKVDLAEEDVVQVVCKTCELVLVEWSGGFRRLVDWDFLLIYLTLVAGVGV